MTTEGLYHGRADAVTPEELYRILDHDNGSYEVDYQEGEYGGHTWEACTGKGRSYQLDKLEDGVRMTFEAPVGGFLYRVRTASAECRFDVTRVEGGEKVKLTIDLS